jgi:hypothetical protein|tara:strand:- start:222 stop:575 length:354 start_codon:yes stop_codon:yes gene_type:complete
MIKPFAIAVSGVLAGSAAWAGPFVNVENNAGYQDGYLGSTTDIHIGYEGGDGTYGYYLQGGPAIVSPDGGDVEMELSGKIGGSVQATDNFGVYGEISFITAEDEPSIGTKIGAKWSF